MKKPARKRTAKTSPRNSSPARSNAGEQHEDIRDAVTRLKRERIVDTAVDLFYRQGYGRTTLEQVADAMNVTKPFIYSHFASKNELLLEICSRAIKLAHESLNRASQQEGPAADRLKLVIRDFLIAVLRYQANAVIFSREEKELDPEDLGAINRLRREFDHRLAALLKEGQASGEFQMDDVQLAALAIGGVVGWSPVWYRKAGRLSLEEVAEGLAKLALSMVQAKGGQGSRATKSRSST